MADADSMFLFEIAVEELKVHCNCKEFLIKGRFMDIFLVNLKNPNEKVGLTTKSSSKTKRISRNLRAASQKKAETKVISGQSVLLPSNIHHLISDMKANPMEVSLWRRRSPTCLLGLARIPWHNTYLDYLEDTLLGTEKTPALMTETYNVLGPYKSKLVATIKLRVKLTHLRNSHKTNFPHLKKYAILNNPLPGEGGKVVSMCRDDKNALPCKDALPLYCQNVKNISLREDERIATKPEIIDGICNNCENENINYIENEVVEDEGLQAPYLGYLTEPNIKQFYFEKQSLCERDTDWKSNILNLIKSETSIQLKPLTMKRSKSMTDYIFYNYDRPNTKQLYYVGFMSVAEDSPKSTGSSPSKPIIPTKSSLSNQSPRRSAGALSVKFDACKCRQVGPYCRLGNTYERRCTTGCLKMPCSLKEAFPKPDTRIFLKMDQKRVENVDGTVKTKMHLSESMCDCTCECTFGYTKTTYCDVCKGFEVQGDDELKTPFPCPIFHKLVEQRKLKSRGSAEWSDKFKNTDALSQYQYKLKRDETLKASNDKAVMETGNHKKGKRKIDVRFKFDYGYKGIPPKIGHAKCGFPCGGGGRPGIDPNVPRHMGWLWTAENVPGLKYRPSWKPGAANKQVVRLLKIAKHPELLGKKKRKKQDSGKKKKNEKHALLIVHKKDGEYNVAMETMKIFPKPRALNQYPYEDKEPLMYTIGRTAEENLERKKVKEKRARRLEAEKRAFIQKTFQNMCQDICIRTYRQALGILPKMEEPLCKCFPDEPPPDIFGLEIPCPCSDDENLSNLESGTDSDEWIVEFTPPNANYDPGYKPKKIVYVDKETQYSYLDYRVKLLDTTGAEIPRFFKGPDGKQQCSDLGGFWSADHKWLEINVDGFVGPDQRWAPSCFIGPNGENVEAIQGKFQDANSEWYVIGVDGYVDTQGKWRFTIPSKCKTRKPIMKEKSHIITDKYGKKKERKPQPGTSFTCFDNIAPEDLATLGIVGHGQDHKLLYSNKKQLASKGITLPKTSTVPRAPSQKKRYGGYDPQKYKDEREKCVHPHPSPKGVIAVDSEGYKKYFKMKDFKNNRQKDRLISLKEQGISLSSFHSPCFNSFIDTEHFMQQGDQRRQKGSHKPKTYFADTDFDNGGTIMQRHGYEL